MSAQNFDPEWARHLKHDPDKPLGAGIPSLSISWKDCLKKAGLDGGEKPPDRIVHDEKRRAEGAMEPSRTWITITLRIRATERRAEERMTIIAETATSCQELAERIAYKAGANPEDISFVQKQGSQYRVLFRHEQVARHMSVNGLGSFKRQKWPYEDPKVIIGAGHIGLRMAMFLNKAGDDFVVFDRMFRVGGTSWMYQANSTSKLQTEYGAYHLDYGEEYKIPTDFTTPWPSRNALLDHFQRVAEDQGILPHIRLNSNVKHMEVVYRSKDGPMPYRVQRYELAVEQMEAGRLRYGKLIAGQEDSEDTETMFKASSICMFPGNLTLPRQQTYPGEDIFGGDIGYAMFNEIDYHKLEGENVTIVGHGAFAVENIRTCCEFDVAQIFLVCRRRNLSCPRVVSWMSNRSLNPLSNVRFMRAMEPMYSFIGLDPWKYHSVTANEKQTTCYIDQKARFGIGDIYFLSIYMGKCELIEDPMGVKRLTEHTVHLGSGRKLPCKALLKLLGLVGEMDNDRLLQIKEMVGFWVNEDPRRYIVAEPVSVKCNQMGGTSLSPGAYSWALEGIYFVDYPMDFVYGALGSGTLPRHKADTGDEGTPRPAYVVDARHGSQTGMTVNMFTPGIQELESTAGFIKAVRHRLCHPTKKFLAQAKEDWDHYASRMLAGGFGADRPYPEYPYTPEVVLAMYQKHKDDSGEPSLPCDEEDLARCKK